MVRRRALAAPHARRRVSRARVPRDRVSRGRSGGEALTAAARPGNASLARLRREADACRACELWARATQTVFGEGAASARVVLVGEQPGDAEDRAGRPFVGPAGQVLDRALAQAGLERDATYVTNAVKHFKWKPAPRGKRRLHDKPSRMEVKACLPWLHAELAAVHPDVVVCLGATAAQALLGKGVRVLRDRGRILSCEHAEKALVTVHPSSILREEDEDLREQAFEAFVADLRTVTRLVRAAA